MLSNRLSDNLKVHIRSSLARIGVEVSAYTGSFQDHRSSLLKRGNVETVWDVGAHIGQYASGLRRQGFRNGIISLEPARDAYWELSRRAASDPRWRTLNVAFVCDPSISQVLLRTVVLLSVVLDVCIVIS